MGRPAAGSQLGKDLGVSLAQRSKGVDELQKPCSLVNLLYDLI